MTTKTTFNSDKLSPESAVLTKMLSKLSKL